MAEPPSAIPGIIVDLPGQQRAISGLVGSPTSGALGKAGDIADDNLNEYDAYRREMTGEFSGYYAHQTYNALKTRYDQLKGWPRTPERDAEMARIQTEGQRLFNIAKNQYDRTVGRGARPWPPGPRVRQDELAPVVPPVPVPAQRPMRLGRDWANEGVAAFASPELTPGVPVQADPGRAGEFAHPGITAPPVDPGRVGEFAHGGITAPPVSADRVIDYDPVPAPPLFQRRFSTPRGMSLPAGPPKSENRPAIQEAEPGPNVGRFAAPPMAAATPKETTDLMLGGVVPPLGLINPVEVYNRIAKPIGSGFMRGAASLVDIAGAPAKFASQRGWLPPRQPGDFTSDDLSRWLRGQGPQLPEPQGLREEFERTLYEAAGGLPAGIVIWTGGLPVAAVHGWNIAEHLAERRGREATTREKLWGAAVEAVARKWLGFATKQDWGRMTNALVFGGTAGVTGALHGQELRETGIQAVINFLLGALARNISPREMAQIRAAQEAAARGEGKGALRHLDPLLRSRAEEIARAAYDDKIILDPTAGGEGRDVGPPRRPRPRPPKLGPADTRFQTHAGQVYRVTPEGQTILASGETVAATPRRSQATIYMDERLAVQLMDTINKWTDGPTMITLPTRQPNVMPAVRVYGFNPATNVWRHMPQARTPFSYDPAPGMLPLQLWDGGRRFAFASKIRNVMQPGQEVPPATGWTGGPREPGEPASVRSRTAQRRAQGRVTPAETVHPTTPAAVRVGNQTFAAANHVEAAKIAASRLGITEDQVWARIIEQDRHLHERGHPSPGGLESDGFVTSTGRYVSREEALRIAQAADQVKPKSDSEYWSALQAEELKPQTQAGQGGGRPPPIPPQPPAIVPPGGGFTMPPAGGRSPLEPHSLPPVLSTEWRLANERTEAVLGATITQRERADALIRDRATAWETMLAGISDAARMAMGTAWMRGLRQHIPARFRRLFTETERAFEMAEIAERMTGQIHYEVRTNYFPAAWHPKDRDAATRYGRSTATARPKYTQSKVFSDFQEGIDAGFTPITTNLGTLAVMRLEAGHRAMERVLAMQRLQESGLAILESQYRKMYPIERAAPTKRQKLQQQLFRTQGPGGAMVHKLRAAPRDAPRPRGPYTNWEDIVVGGYRYLIHPRAKELVQWGLQADQQSLARYFGLRHGGMTERGIENAGSAWMNARNTVIPMKLALSAFHAVHMLHIKLSQPWSVITQSVFNKGDLPAKELWRQIRDMSSTGSFAYGKRTGEVFNRPDHELTPMEVIEKNLMIAGGFNPHQPSIYQVHAERMLRRLTSDDIPTLLQQAPTHVVEQFAKAWGMSAATARYTFAQMARGIEEMQHPLFGVWIPAIKTAAYLQQAKTLVLRRPDIVSGSHKASAELRHELRQIAKSIDDRFGMMQYDKVFGPVGMKRLAMGSFLSVGWNYGFLRTFVFGPGRDIARAGRNIASIVSKRDLRRERGESSREDVISSRTAYMSTYMFFALLTGAIATVIFTGRPPEDMKDAIYIRLPDGSRLTTPMFTREYGGLYYHVRNEGVGPGLIELVMAKLNSLVTAIWDVVRGHDYYGRQTYDPNAPFWMQALQVAKHVAIASSMPISVQGVHSGQVTDPQQTAMTLMGLSPAPRYVEKSGIVAAIQHAYNMAHPRGVTEWSDIERSDDVRQVRRNFNEFRRTGDNRYLNRFTQQLAEYVQKNPQKASSVKKMINSWMLPEGAIQFKTLHPATQIALLKKMTPQERATYLPFVNRRDPRALGGVLRLQ